MKILFMICMIIFMDISLLAQCNVKIINRPDGTTVRYLNPNMVGTGTSFEVGLSVSNNGNSYFINTTVRYFSTPKKQIGSLKIQLQNNSALVLKLYDSQIATTNGNNVSLGVYSTTQQDIQFLRNSQLVRIVFTESDGTNQIVTASKNSSILMDQINCLNN